MSAPHRIYLVGAHATGKTTLARWIRDQYGLPMISEVARGVLAEMEAELGSLRTNVELVNEYQRQVFERQIAAESQMAGSFVSDRAFCNLCYAAHHSTILGEIARDPRLAEYMDSVRGGLVFYLRPHTELLAEDGVRAGVEWEEVVRIDGMVKLLLEMFEVPYIPVESLSMQERVRLVERVLELVPVTRAERKGSHCVLEPRARVVSRPAAPAPGHVHAHGNGNGNGQAHAAVAEAVS